MCTANLHCLVHFPFYIQRYGPFWTFWCFVIERYYGSLSRLTHSRRAPSVNLANAVPELERIKLLLLLPNVQTTIDQANMRNVLAPKTGNVGKPIAIRINQYYEFYQRYEFQENEIMVFIALY
jgi:hypothetical protein